MTLTRKLTAGAAAVIASLGLAALAPAEAEAAGCPAEGRLIESYPVTSHVNNVQIASLNIYYSDRYEGTNTACLVHYGPTWGRESSDVVQITRCDSYYGCDTFDSNNLDREYGDFRYYAGPVRVTASRYRCVYVYGSIPDPYANYEDHGYTQINIHGQNIGCAAAPFFFESLN